jgi:hypothetical protein
MKTALLSLILTTQFAIPIADKVPTLNVESSCRAVSNLNKQSGLADTQSFDGCMRDENAARQELVPIWTSFAAADRTRCSDEASSGGVYSYVELLVCLQMARDASAMNASQLQGARKKK